MKTKWVKYQSRNPAMALESARPLSDGFRRAVVIPVLAENKRLPETLASLGDNPAEALRETLVLLVVNHSKATPEALRAENRALLAQLRSGTLPLPENLQAAWLETEVPENGGVGSARKAGMDSVLPRLADGASLLFCLDADTTVEADYLTATAEAFAAHPAWSGAAIAFRHRCDGAEPELAAAIAAYERYLAGYVAGLREAGSPYAYFVMGSAMACRADAYVKAGGMRQRAGGEDFYFMQALRKIGEIGRIETTCVHPAARISQRVPFGTGPRLAELIAGGRLREYRPGSFALLSQLLTAAETGDPEQLAAELPKLDERIAKFLAAQEFATAWPRILANTPRERAAQRQAFACWFDAFRTLKFIHAVND